MSKDIKKNQQNHADWSSEQPSKKTSNAAHDTKKEMNNKKSSLDDHFEHYNSKNSSHKNSSSKNDNSYSDDYQD